MSKKTKLPTFMKPSTAATGKSKVISSKTGKGPGLGSMPKTK